MMVQGTSRHTCSLLAVTCGSVKGNTRKDVLGSTHKYPFQELVSSGRLEVQTLTNPSQDDFSKALELYQPNIVYFQGERLENNEVGPLVWGGVDLSTVEAMSRLFDSVLPSTVYLEVPHGEKLADALHIKGISYVIYWKEAFSYYVACHFRHTLFSVVQSSSCNTWDAFQLARASFGLYCIRNSLVHPAGNDGGSETTAPFLLGDPLTFNIIPPEIGEGEYEEGSLDTLPTVKIHDDDVNLRFLVCGLQCALDASLLRSLEDGLNALLSIEIRGSKLHGKFSASPPIFQAEMFSRGVVTMKCDMSTGSFAHISLLVSGSAQTCFDDQLLENHIKHEIIEKNQPVNALPKFEGSILPLSEPRRSASIACGAKVFEVFMNVPSWASQVLRQLAPDTSYRSLVALGIASIQGAAVASFEKDDAERLLFFCPKEDKYIIPTDLHLRCPTWLKPPAPRKNSFEPCHRRSSGSNNEIALEEQVTTTKMNEDKESELMNGVGIPMRTARQTWKVAAMRPIPHIRRYKMPMFLALSSAVGHDGGQVKANFPAIAPTKYSNAKSASGQRKLFSGSYQGNKIVSLNPLPLRKHDCNRNPIQSCSEEEFLKDVMEFLILRGHTRLIPQGGVAEFPEAVLNAKRLDLYNLYKEVVTRGGFHVGNGINWKGQVFSKMRNYTMSNRMTGVGNTLKRHYETYLMEYELAHDDVGGECCLLCHSGAAGDWVNCGICGEWAHFGCDRRQGLGAFKDYAKTEGLEYICPHCSATNFKKKPRKAASWFSRGLMV